MTNKIDNSRKLSAKEHENREKFVEVCAKEVRDYFFELSDTKTEQEKEKAIKWIF